MNRAFKLVWDEDFESGDFTGDPWRLAREAGVNVLSDKDFRAGIVYRKRLVAALFDSVTGSSRGRPQYSFDVAVHPEFQRQHLGAELMDLGISLWRSSDGELDILLDVVSPIAQNMLLRRGFVEISRSPGHVIMSSLDR